MFLFKNVITNEQNVGDHPIMVFFVVSGWSVLDIIKVDVSLLIWEIDRYWSQVILGKMMLKYEN